MNKRQDKIIQAKRILEAMEDYVTDHINNCDEYHLDIKATWLIREALNQFVDMDDQFGKEADLEEKVQK